MAFRFGSWCRFSGSINRPTSGEKAPTGVDVGSTGGSGSTHRVAQPVCIGQRRRPDQRYVHALQKTPLAVTVARASPETPNSGLIRQEPTDICLFPEDVFVAVRRIEGEFLL